MLEDSEGDRMLLVNSFDDYSPWANSMEFKARKLFHIVFRNEIASLFDVILHTKKYTDV